MPCAGLRAVVVAAFSALLATSLCAAEKQPPLLPATAWPELLASARAEAKALRPATPADVQAARAEFAKQFSQLDRVIARYPVETSGASWRQFLHWEETQAVIADGKVTSLQLYSLHPWWEQGSRTWKEPSLVRAAAALRNWAIQVTRLAKAETGERYAARLAATDAAWAQWSASPTEADWMQLGGLVTELHQLGEAAEAVRFLRQQASKPNLRIVAQADWIDRSSRRDINRPIQVNEQMDRVTTHGSGTISGIARVLPIPSEDRGLLGILLEATAAADTHSTVCGVKLNFTARSTTCIKGLKPLELVMGGLDEGPADVCTDSDLEYTSMCRGCGIVPRIAEKRVYAGQGEAEARAEERSRVETGEDLDDTAQMVRQQIYTKPDNPLVRELVAFNPGLSRRWRTTTKELEGWGWRAGTQVFAGPSVPPVATLPGALLVQTHETYLNRMLGDRWGGKKLTFEELGNKLGSMLSDDEAEEAELEPGWTLTTAPEPVRIRLNDNRASVLLLFDGFESPSGGEYPGMAVATSYRIETKNGRLHLYRDKKVDMLTIEQVADPKAEAPFRMLALFELFRPSFEKSMLREQIIIKEQSVGLAKNAPPLKFTQSVTSKGWLTTVLDDQALPTAARGAANKK